MSIQSSYKKKLKKQIEILYESIAKSLDKKIQDAVHNLILFGYTDIFLLNSRTSFYFCRHCRMSLDLGFSNTIVDFDWDLEAERSLIEEEIFIHIHSQDLNDDDIKNQWIIFDKMFKEAEKNLSKKFPQVAKYKVQGYYRKKKVDFFTRYIIYLADKYTSKLYKNKSNFFDNKFTKELSYLLNFFIENKIMPSYLTIHETGDGGGKDSDYIFESEKASDDAPLEIQVSDDELILRKDHESTEIMFIFKDKKLRDALNQKLINLYKKKTNVYKQERFRGSTIKSFYIECDINWRIF